MTRWTAIQQRVFAGVTGTVLCAVGTVDGQPLSLRHVIDVDTTTYPSIPKTLGVEIDNGGGVLLGFATPYNTTPSDSYIWRFESGQAEAEFLLLPVARHMVFDIDAYGSLSYAMTGLGPGVTVGDDLGQAVGDPLERFTARQLFYEGQGSGGIGYPIAYAMDRNGLPAFASPAFSGGPPTPHTVWRFNPQSNTWDATAPPQVGYFTTAGAYMPQVIDFTLDNRLIHAFYDDIPTTRQLRVLVEAPSAGWLDLAAGADIGYPQAGMSVAVSPVTGEVAFAFVDGSLQLTVGRYNGDATVYETVAGTTARLSAHSLRYDDQGQLALVYTEGLSNPGSTDGGVQRPLYLSRRSATGEWNATDLEVDAYYGEVAFGESGEIFIGTVLNGQVVLMSDDIPALVGDVDLSGTTDINDVRPFVLGLTDALTFRDTYGFDAVRTSDFNGDGLFNFDDILPFAETLNLSESQTQALIRLVPEPGVGVVLLAMLAGVGPRRVFVRR